MILCLAKLLLLKLWDNFGFVNKMGQIAPLDPRPRERGPKMPHKAKKTTRPCGLGQPMGLKLKTMIHD